MSSVWRVRSRSISLRSSDAVRRSVGTGVMGGMMAATFLAIFFVPLFFRLVTDRKLSEKHTAEELRAEAEHERERSHKVTDAPHHARLSAEDTHA